MAYLAICTFDLKNATYQDYLNAYSDLEDLGLRKVIIGNSGSQVVTPTTTTAGEFNATSAASLRDYLRDQAR